MSRIIDLREALEAVRRHVERSAAGTGLQARSMKVDLRFGLRTDAQSLVRPVLRTDDQETAGAPHSVSLSVDLTGGTEG